MPSYADYCKEQYTKLTSEDDKLFGDVVAGLVKMGWVCKGGNGKTLFYLQREAEAIKVFRQAESPEVIRICFTSK